MGSNEQANPTTNSDSVRDVVDPAESALNEFRVWVGLSSPSRGLEGAPSPHYSDTASSYIHTDTAF